jgi:predicted ribosome quality control (RQC) complex YloA/Tae2 family protein
LPGKVYIFPPDKGKKNPLKTTESEFFSFFSQTEKRVQNFLYENYSGISPLMASDICIRAGINPSDSVSEIEKEKLFFSFKETISKINENQFVYTVFLDKNKTPNDFSCFNLSVFPPEYEKAFFDSPSEMLEFFYKERDLRYYALQKSHDLRRLISVNIERIVKKLDLLQKTLSDTENRNTFRLYGELITANFYAVKKGDKVLKAIDFTKDTAPEVKIPLDPNLTPNENAQKYFKKYNKQKRTREAVVEQISQAKEELEYLESAANAAETAADEADVAEIREELATQGFIKKVSKKGKKERAKKSKPLKFTSADGFDIYVGKSNTQNDELTIKFAVQDDIWLHTQKIPGSHVIIKTEGKEAPLKTIEQAAQLAAYFSKARQAGVVPVDYTTRKNVKKPNGSRPGMVIYDNYKTAFVTPELI